jgi:hypothetical protein
MPTKADYKAALFALQGDYGDLEAEIRAWETIDESQKKIIEIHEKMAKNRDKMMENLLLEVEKLRRELRELREHRPEVINMPDQSCPTHRKVPIQSSAGAFSR